MPEDNPECCPPQTPAAGTGLEKSINVTECPEFEGCGGGEGSVSIGSSRRTDRREKDIDRKVEESRHKSSQKMIAMGTVWHCKIWFLICTTLLLHPQVW